MFEAATPTPIVMAGLDPAIHGTATADTSVAEGVDHRDKPGDDEGGRVAKPNNLGEFVEQRFRVFKVRCVEAFGEPVVNRREQVAGFGLAALVSAQPREA